MGTSDPPVVTEPPRCTLCGEPLGVYEPLVEVEGEQIIRTSRAARPELASAANGSTYHARCFDQQHRAGS
jgi:hypothetical protein